MAKPFFADRLKSLFGLRPKLDDDFFDELAEYLVEGDLGAVEAFALADRLKAACRKEGITDEAAVRNRLAALMVSDMEAKAGEPRATGLLSDRLTVILLLGVNGVGKTTSAAKLAAWYRTTESASALLAAGDTFRAAAIDQLKIHGERLSLRVVAHQQGGDPAAVIYDALETALARGERLIIADTAGRMHTKSALVEELRKIDRVVESKGSGAVYRKYLVLDATTGRNALAQAETFDEAVSLDGVILTKYDSSARGGAAYSLALDRGLPVVFICDGEGYEDIRPFDRQRYANEFVGLA